MNGLQRIFGLGIVLTALLAPNALHAAERLPLDTLVRQVKIALLQIEQSAKAQNLPSIHQATLELNTELTIDAKGKISFWIVELGSGVSSNLTTRIKIVLTPPPVDSTVDVASNNLAEALKKAVLAGAQAIDEAGRGNPPLVPVSLEAMVRFAVKLEGNAGFQLIFPPFSGSVGAGVASGAIQSITVAYEYDDD